MRKITLPNFLRPKHRNRLRRLGSRRDGGYILTEDMILNSHYLLSFGIDSNIDFEKDFTQFEDKIVHAYDYSLSSKWIFICILRILRKTITRLLCFWNLPALGRLTHLYRFVYTRLKSRSEINKFFTGKNKLYKEIIGVEKGFTNLDRREFFKYPSTTIEQAYELLKSNNEGIVLKMDIEGGEWSCMDFIIKNSDKINGLVMELHNLEDSNENTEILKKLCEHFNLIHVSIPCFVDIPKKGKLPDFLEVSFENKNLTKGQKQRTSEYTYPITGLDFAYTNTWSPFQIDFNDKYFISKS